MNTVVSPELKLNESVQLVVGTARTRTSGLMRFGFSWAEALKQTERVETGVIWIQTGTKKKRVKLRRMSGPNTMTVTR